MGKVVNTYMRIDEISTNEFNDFELSHKDYRRIINAIKNREKVGKQALDAKSKIMKMWKAGDKDIVKYKSALSELDIDLDKLTKKAIKS